MPGRGGGRHGESPTLLPLVASPGVPGRKRGRCHCHCHCSKRRVLSHSTAHACHSYQPSLRKVGGGREKEVQVCLSPVSLFLLLLMGQRFFLFVAKHMLPCYKLSHSPVRGVRERDGGSAGITPVQMPPSHCLSSEILTKLKSVVFTMPKMR